MTNDWQQRLAVERLIKRAIKKLKARVIDCYDAEAIRVLRIARLAVKYERTFEAQKILVEAK
jgi:hypothetical protein